MEHVSLCIYTGTLLTKCGPNLPRHDQTTTDGRWTILGREDGDGDFLQTHAKAKEDTADGELTPGLRGSHANWSAERENGGDKDGVTTTEEIIDGIRNPCTAAK